jgi:archaemetzincin
MPALSSLPVTLLPMGEPDPAAIADLAEDLKRCGFRARLARRRPLLPAAWNADRGQYDARALLEATRSFRGERLFVIVDADLFVPGLNFVFGIAESPGRAAVISLARLGFDADGRQKRERALKEAIHELGHTLGLKHCPDPGCVMWFSNTLAETDRKGTSFCAVCRGKLSAA